MVMEEQKQVQFIVRKLHTNCTKVVYKLVCYFLATALPSRLHCNNQRTVLVGPM